MAMTEEMRKGLGELFWAIYNLPHTGRVPGTCAVCKAGAMARDLRKADREQVEREAHPLVTQCPSCRENRKIWGDNFMCRRCQSTGIVPCDEHGLAEWVGWVPGAEWVAH